MCDAQEERAAIALAAMLGLDEDVFQPKSAAAEKSREVVEVEREADRLLARERKQRFSSGARTE